MIVGHSDEKTVVELGNIQIKLSESKSYLVYTDKPRHEMGVVEEPLTPTETATVTAFIKAAREALEDLDLQLASAGVADAEPEVENDDSLEADDTDAVW
jgi:hypothetical protein